MLIYYPNAKKAFRIKSKNPIPPPFIQTIIGAMKEDYGLIIRSRLIGSIIFLLKLLSLRGFMSF